MFFFLFGMLARNETHKTYNTRNHSVKQFQTPKHTKSAVEFTFIPHKNKIGVANV